MWFSPLQLKFASSSLSYALELLAGWATGSERALLRMQESSPWNSNLNLRTPALKSHVEGLTLRPSGRPSPRQNVIELHGRSGS